MVESGRFIAELEGLLVPSESMGDETGDEVGEDSREAGIRYSKVGNCRAGS